MCPNFKLKNMIARTYKKRHTSWTFLNWLKTYEPKPKLNYNIYTHVFMAGDSTQDSWAQTFKESSSCITIHGTINVGLMDPKRQFMEFKECPCSNAFQTFWWFKLATWNIENTNTPNSLHPRLEYSPIPSDSTQGVCWSRKTTVIFSSLKLSFAACWCKYHFLVVQTKWQTSANIILNMIRTVAWWFLKPFKSHSFHPSKDRMIILANLLGRVIRCCPAPFHLANIWGHLLCSPL